MRNFIRVLWLLVLTSCSDVVESTAFVRADPRLMLVAGGGAAGTGPKGLPWPTVSHEAVEPGSDFDFGNAVYALPDQRLLRLDNNLQIIDIRDPDAPRIEGRLELADFPVSMHVAGDRVIVLSNAKEYGGERTDIENAQGGAISSIDISDRAHPKLLARVPAPGWLVSGVLKDRGADPLAVYVALSSQEPNGFDSRGTKITQLASFSIDRKSGAITLRTEHALPELQAHQLQSRGNYLIAVGSQTVNNIEQQQLQVFDVSSADAQLRPLGQLPIAGAKVADRRALDIQGSVVRVISSGWLGYPETLAPGGATTEHHVETFDLAHDGQLARLDHCSFQGTDQVDRSVFVSAGALIVGVQRAGANLIGQNVRAIAIDEQGKCRDIGSPQLQDIPVILRATQSGSRLLTIGKPHESKVVPHTPEWPVLLYDVSVLGAAKLLAEAHVSGTREYTDPESVDVFEGAPQIASTDGTPETGLLLLTASGARDLNRSSQLLTFSDHTLTRRGGVALARNEEALLVGGMTLAALTRFDLTVLGVAGEPERLGTLLTAPYRNTAIYDLGDYQLRLRDVGMGSSQFQLYVTQASQLAESAPLSTLDLAPGFGRVDQIGNLILHELPATSQLSVYDYSDPRQPRKRGEITSSFSGETFRSAFSIGEVSAFVMLTPQQSDQSRWSSPNVRPLDLRDPDAPHFLDPIAMPETSHADHVIAADNKLYVSWYEPEGNTNLVRENLTAIDLTDPDHVRVSEPINVPGRVVAVHADSLITEVSDAGSITLARARVEQGKAAVERTLELPAGVLSHIELDQRGRLLTVYEAPEGVTLHIIEPRALSLLGSMPIDRHASWVEAAQDRAAFRVLGGVLIVDYGDPAAPFAYSYLPNAHALRFDGDYIYGDVVRDARTRQHIQ